MKAENQIWTRLQKWYYGVAPQPDDMLERYRLPVQSEASKERYHNLTLSERYTAWKNRSGLKAFRYLYNTVATMVCLAITGVLLTTICWLPEYGVADKPVNNEVPQKYIEDGVQDTGALNVVAGMILDYRAFDTFGESCVLFVAACAVLTLLQNVEKEKEDALTHEMEDPRKDSILRKTAIPIIPLVLVFGVYVVLHGHLGPGGGFAGGSIIGAGLILYASAYGTKRARKFMNFRVYQRLVSASLIFYALVKGYSFFTGANHIPSGIPQGTPGNIMSGGLILPLNICVGVIVACTFYELYILFSKGELQ